MTKVLTLVLIFISVNSAWSADENIMSQRHSFGVPEIQQESRSGLEFRENFKIYYEMQEYQKHGFTFFNNSKLGLGLMKVGNNDAAFRDIVAKTSSVIKKWKSGEEFLDRLVEYTNEKGCIPKLVSPSHGWTSSRGGDIHGLSGVKGVKDGLYATPQTQPENRAKRSRNISVDLKNLIDQGQVRFCENCLIQIFACNVSVHFVETFSKVTNCQVVAATGKASPRFQGKVKEGQDKEVAKYLEYNAAHHWFSSPGTGAEYENETGVWVRVTPPLFGDVYTTENLGRIYIAL